jgi:hypothetical protein
MDNDHLREVQEMLDRRDVRVGQTIEISSTRPIVSLIENGDDDCPLLIAIGIDRFGRIWSQDGRVLTLLGEFGG